VLLRPSTTLSELPNKIHAVNVLRDRSLSSISAASPRAPSTLAAPLDES
jgi:hypothetical protein